MAFLSPWLRAATVLVWMVVWAGPISAPAQEVDPEEAQAAATNAKFLTVLERSPKRGTALDKVYGFHVERGSLDEFIKDYRQKAAGANGAAAASKWMIIGLMDSLRGQDAASVEAFGKAEELDAANYLASYYMGQALVLVGQPDKATDAFERAIQRKPGQADQLEIFQALGRVYQRAQKNDKALEIWNRLEKQFPNDARVQEQIAMTLLEENEFAAALPRFENLTKTSKDKYRQSQFQLEAAEIKVRLGNSAEAIREFEKLLSNLNPDNWLFREVRRRIENVYLRTDDQAGLIAYYEAWTKKNPEDLEAISRLARLLAGLGRGPEALAWLEKGLKVAPSRKELRNALIAQLLYEQKFPEAIAQYEQLDKYEPNNPDTLRDWGRLILKDTRRDEATRKKDAAAVWRRLTASRPMDPLIASQVAELFRHSEMVDEALTLYRRSIELAPEAAQYKEYLGEYFHSLQRKDEALAIWRQMAEGKARTASNIARLAEVLAGFGYLTEAVQTHAEACKLDPKEINLQIKQADLLSQADQHEEALTQLALVQKMAANDEEREAWLQRELKELQTLDRLKGRITEVEMELAGLPAAKSDQEKAVQSEKWFWLARAHEAERQLKEAAAAVARAGELAPQSIPILMSTARIQESQQNLLAAVDTNTRLAAVDRRYRTEYLKKVAQLEVQLGRRDKAIQAGRDVLAAAPGNPELYEFFSQLCFQLGENEEGLQALRRAVRVNPSEPKGLLMLASALGEQFRTGESIELYWRAFDKAANLEDRLLVVPRLTELYLQTNQFDRLLERLENKRREPNQQRELTICIAQAYQSAGDDGNARQELEKLLTEETRDTQLLQQLVKLCEQDGDLDAAVRFQQQMNKVAPGKDGTMRLAFLLMKMGDTEEATALLTRATAEEKDPEQLIKSIDSLLAQKNFEQVLGITDRLVRDQPKNWELLYREGVALASTKPEDAARRFEAILALNIPDDEPTLIARNQAKKNQARVRSPAVQFREMHPFVQRTQYSYQIRRAIGLDQDNYYYGGGYPQQQPFWSPHDFGTARLACMGWLNLFARNTGKEEEFLKLRRTPPDKSQDRRAIVDSYYLAAIRQETAEQYAILKQMSRQPDADPGIKSLYLSMLASRGGPRAERIVNAETGQSELKLEPLDNDELEHVLKVYKDLDADTAMMHYGQTFLELVAAELKRAGRTDEADAMLKQAVESATSPIQIASVLAGTIQRGDHAMAIKLLERLTAMKPESPPALTGGAFNYAQYFTGPQYQSQILAQLIAQRAQKNEMNDVLALWDQYLALAASRYEADLKQTASARKRNANSNPQGTSTYYSVWRGNTQRGEQLDFPTPNAIYDQASLQMLRQTFVVYKDAESMDALIAHFQKKLKDETTPQRQQIFWKLGLGYVYWWNDDKDEALAALSDAGNLLPGNEEMTFELARVHEKRGNPEEALALIEALPAADQQTMQKREIAALRLSVNSGNIDRARTAAERLFGLRLDSNLQIQLARQMHQLGMHEQAEAVLARAGRQAGNKTDVLMTLMQQYQSQGKNDVATQIAHQLLRRSAGNSAQYAMGSRAVQSGRDDSSARQQALQVLKRSGKLPEMIKKVEDQLSHSPKSQKLIETLIEYYTADGNEKKVTELSAKYAETKGDDPQFRYQLAMQLVRSGKHKESLEHFKAALKKEPRLLRNSYWEVQNAFESADKLDDLASLYEAIDLKSFRNSPYELTNLISNMSNRPKTKDRAVALFKKAWQLLPDQRSQLLSNLNGDAFWKMPEIYDYARQGIIPTETSLNQSGVWAGFGNIQSWNNDGKMTTLLNRFLTIATQSKKLDDLATEVDQARKKLPTWQAGGPLLALIDLRRGRVDEARMVFEKLLPTLKGVQNVGYYTHWEIAQELMAHESCVDLAIRYLEAAVNEPELMSGNEFSYSPGKALVTLYKQRGRKDDARRVILKAMAAKPNSNYDRQYEIYRRIRNAMSLANEIRALGYPVDAIRLYQETLARPDEITLAQRYGGGNMKTELQQGFDLALKELKPESLPELLSGAGDAADNKQSEPVDLVLLVESRELDKTTMSSALGKLVAELVKAPEMVAKTKQALSDVRRQRPDDISALILAAHLSISTGDDADASLKQLLELIDTVPLEPPPAKGGFTAKQREAAQRQTALWLVARECLKKKTHLTEGKKLAERALEASRRLADHGYTMSILREWGQVALDAGDRPTAEKCWSEMLEVVIPKPAEKPKKKEEAKTSSRESTPGESKRLQVAEFAQQTLCRSSGPLTAWERMLAPAIAGQVILAAPPSAVMKSPASGTKGNVVTLAQFEQAAQISKMAAENGFAELSFRAISQALHAGPPIEVITADPGSASGFPAVAQPLSSDQAPVLQKVELRLAAIENLWRKMAVDDATIYQNLKQTVLPEGRPLEVFLYPRPLAASVQTQTPQSVGLLLVQAAIRARKVEDLKQALDSRLHQPLGELPGLVLMTQLALVAKDTPAATALIEKLSERLKQDSLQYSSELACHVAIPAMRLPDLPPAAVTLLERAVDHFTQNVQQGRGSAQEEPMRTYRFSLARFHFQSGNREAGKKHLEDYLTYLIPLYRNYGGDYGQYRRRLEMMKLAAEYANAGMQAESLDCLGQYADSTVSRNYGQDNPGRAGAMILAGLAQLPAGEQYELLKKWTLPTADRKSVRVVASLVPADKSPTAFDTVRGIAPRGPRETQLLSTADLLMNSANQAGKLDELLAELQPHADQNLENAKFLLLLTRIARREGAAVASTLNEHLEERRKNLPSQGDYQKRPQLVDALLAKAAMRDPHLMPTGRQLGINFFLHASRVQDHLLMAMMRHDYNASLVGELARKLDRQPTRTGLKHWTAGAIASSQMDAVGSMPMWWIANEGMVTHICGPDQSHLYLKYPLTGTFEISCDAWMGGWAEANTGFGGIVFLGLNGGGDTSIFPIGNRNDTVRKPDPLEQSDHFNRVSLKVSPDTIRYLVNGHLIHTEPHATTTSPWFFLHCDRVWQTCFRNIQITGEPIIPAEVRLSQKNSLSGWCSGFYGESQPARVAPSSADGETPEYDWWSHDGVIHGRILPTSGFGRPLVAQSRLFQDRPLLDGDRLRYEFWYEAGEGGTHVHPALDRLALLLEPGGVKLHWMTDGTGPEDAYSGLTAENAVIDESVQRGEVSLMDRSWNAVEIALNEDVATIELNGAIVCQRQLEIENSRQFGFYHDKNTTSAKIRNVVLTGNWPKTLSHEILADLTAPADDDTPEERRILSNVIEEKFRATDLDWVLLRTRSLPLAERYEALKRWVLPNEDHGTLRIYADVAPTNPPPVSPIIITPVSLGTAKSEPNTPTAVSSSPHQVPRRQRVGGELVAPALDLVAVASELGKLNELADLVTKIPPDAPEQVKRSQLAMQVLIAIAANDLPQAETTMAALTPTRTKGLPDSLPVVERWPELVASWEATRVPELRKAAVTLLDLVVDSANRKGVGLEWDTKVRSARQHAMILRDKPGELPAASSTSPKGQWTQSTLLRAQVSSGGVVSRWRFDGAESLHLGGDGNDLLYFQSPLRGTFTVEGELSTFGWREAQLAYAAQWAGPHYTLEATNLGNLNAEWVGPKFSPKLDPQGDWFHCRMEVTPDKISYYANERLIHEAPLMGNPDPWLGIRSTGQYAAATRSLRILGQPEIPAELQLAAREDLQGWWAGMYGDSITGETPAWKKDGQEIVGHRFVQWDGRTRESLLQYHRPLLEDGEITYDFFYVPDQTHVHPTLGRMVILLDKDGVKIHWLTDAQFERGGLAPDNEFVEKENRRGPAQLPLKVNDWNKIKLNLVGDTVSLNLNEIQVFERPVDATNLRSFGLFHYAGESEVRVKDVVYRGNWPRTLPTLKEQELAGNDLELVTFRENELPAQLTWNFRGRPPGNLAVAGNVPTTRRTQVEDGLRIVREPNTDRTTDLAGFQWSQVAVGGDFEITLGYRDFQSTTKSMTHQVPRIEIDLAVGGKFGEHQQTLALVHRRMHDNTMVLSSIHGTRIKPPVEDWYASNWPLTAQSGRIRIVRRSGIAYFLYSSHDSDRWQLLDRRAASTADINELLIGYRGEDLVSTGSVVLTDFSIRAKRLTYTPRIADDELPERLTWNFQGAQPAGMQKWSAEAPNTFEPVADGTRINRPMDPRQKATPVGFNWQGTLRGDFEVTLGYRDFESTTDMADWRSPRVQILVPIGGADNTPANTHTASAGHRRRNDGNTIFTNGVGVRQANGQKVWSNGEQKADRNSGRLRIIRSGSMIHALVAPPGSNDFVLLNSRTASDADISSMSFAVWSDSKQSAASVTFTDLTIRAQELRSK